MEPNETQKVKALHLHIKNQELKKQKVEPGLPSLSYMMGFVPFATPQIFSRMVVLPALALPMMRIRKWGHRY
jgi:hypothetical protein